MVNVIVSSAGVQGPRGNSLLTGHGAPSSSLGIDGDYYMDNTNPGALVIYGPRTAGVWGSGSAFGGGNLTAADGSIIVGGSVGAQTVRTGTLDVVAGLHPAAADWSNNGHKITAVATGVAGTDVANVGQLPTTLPPNGSAGGDLTGTYPNPGVGKINGVAISGTPSTGQVLTAGGSTSAAWSPLPAASTSTPGLVKLDGTSTDIAPLGVQAAGAVGQAADAGHVHAMPRLDQINTPTAPVSMGSQKITSLSNGTAPTDGATFGQIPLVGAAGAGAAIALSSTDASVTNARTPIGAAGGDLVGSTYPNPTVSKINGVALSGTPAAGQVLTASGPAAAAFTTLPAASTSTSGLVRLDGTAGDIAPLGTQAAGAIGQAADAGHVHAMPRLDQAGTPTAAVSLGSQKITNLANGSAASDGAAFGQIPLVGAAGAGAAVALSTTDASVTNSRTPNGTASGDLSGPYPGPTVAKINGTSVPAGPTSGTVLTATSSTTAAWSGTTSGAWVFNAATYGALGDGKFVTDGAMTATSATLTSATASFTAGDVGKAIMVKGAASSTITTLVTTITGFTNSTTVTLAAAATTTVSGALVLWGTDDTAHIQAAINAAITYANAHGSARVFIPIGSGRFYAIAGALVTGGSTLGNSQLTLGAPVPTTSNKSILTIEGVTNGSGLQHWQQNNPQLNGSTLVSFGVFSTSVAQINSINANGNPAVIGGPAQPGGYGISPGVFSNQLVTISNLSVLTTHNANGLTYTAVDFSGIAEASLNDFAYGTTGTVPGNDYLAPNLLANGLSIGVLMPANGNNDNQVCRNISCHGGYTFAFFATEHTVVDRMCLLYCWSAFCPVGTYYTSVGSTHGVTVAQLSVEACTNLINFIGVGSNGSGPWLDIRQLDTEIGVPSFTDRTSGTGLNAALGTVTLTGLYNPANITVAHPTGLKIINGQNAYPVKAVTANYQVTVLDQTILVDATAGAVTVTLISSAWTPNTYTVKKTDSSANAVTIAVVSGEHIDGATTQTLTTQWQKITVVPARVSSNWNWYTT